MPAAAKTPRLTFHLTAWKGPSKVTLIQGLVRNPVTRDYYITQADTVRGQTVQNVVIRRHHANLLYADSQVVTKGGHGSSVGIEHDGRSMIWLGHKINGVGRFPYETGQSGFQTIRCLPDGDISVHRDVACIRNGNRYRGYRLSDAKAGRATLLFSFTIPPWGKRFQGHAVVADPGGGLVCVHRDIATKKESRAVAFRFDGTKVAEINTTRMGDEAEGFLVEEAADGTTTVLVVKRTGGLRPSKRVVEATYWLGRPPPTTMIRVDSAPGITAVFAAFGEPAALKVSSTIRAAKGGFTSRYTHYVQKWLMALGYYRGPADGRWAQPTQDALDTFRRGIEPPWPEDDCVGLPGIKSLTLLRNAAVKATGIDQLDVVP